MNLIALFTSLRGRIPRKIWWLGYIILIAVSSLATFLIDPTSFTSPSLEAYKPSLAKSLLQLLFLWPMLAITVKRLNDRDQPAWLGYAAALLGLAFFAAPHFGFLRDPVNPGTADWMFLTPMALFSLWLFIDNGFLKGTPGPNRYGPDPLGPASGSGGSVPPIAPRRGRTAGAWIRDGIVGGIGCVTALFLLLPGLSIESAVTWSVERMLPSLEDLRDPNRQMRAQPEAWKQFNAGKSAAEEDRYEEAIQYYTRAIDLYGPDTEEAGRALMWRGHAFRRLNRYSEAVDDYSAAIEIEPDAAHRYSYRGKVYAALGQYKPAMRDFDKATRLSPDSHFHYEDRGDALRELKRFDEALAAYDKSIEVAKSISERWYNVRNDGIARGLVGRGQTFRDRGDYKRALEEMNKALTIQNQDSWMYSQRGWVHEKLGNIDKARADYEKAAELYKPSAWLKKALERVRAKQ